MDTTNIRNAYVRYRKASKQETDHIINVMRLADELGLLNIESLKGFVDAQGDIVGDERLNDLYTKAQNLSILHEEVRSAWEELSNLPETQSVYQFMSRMELMAKMSYMPRDIIALLLQGKTCEVDGVRWRIIEDSFLVSSDDVDLWEEDVEELEGGLDG